MRTPVPTVPTALPSVRTATSPRRGVPVAVVSWPGQDDDVPVLGSRATEVGEDWVSVVALTGRAGEVVAGPVGSSVHWVAGVGDREPASWLSAGVALTRAVDARLATGTGERSLQVEVPAGVDEERVAALVRGLALGGYRFKVTAEKPSPTLRTVTLVVASDDAEAARRAADRSGVLAASTALTRDLANTPSNVKDPDWLARTGARLASTVDGLTGHVRDQAWLAKQGFGGVLAVGGGSARPPRMLELHWRPPGVTGPHLVYVGKGITFDTGGISIKPADGMHLMRTDMAGGGAVIAATIGIARLGLPVRVTALVPCAENHVSGTAYRPGDIVRHYGGRTTEVTNTDAEGRMVLADALAYAVATLEPTLLVDVATLTGAMKITLGLRTGGFFAGDEDLAGRLLAAGEAAGEAWWRMPLLEDFAQDVISDIADVRQCPPGPSAITAALFLREFTGGLPWAHLDIAGPARADKTYADNVAGATGFSARTLIELAAGYTG